MWNITFINILVVNFCHQMGQQMMNTLVPKYANALGANAYTVGLLSSVFAISSLLIRPVSTPAFDSFSKKKLLIASIFGIFIVFTMYGLSKSVYMIMAARLLHGICIGCVAPLSLAIASDALPDSKMGRGIGVFSLCQAIGQAVGPNMGLSLSQTIGYSYTFFIGAAIMLIATILSLFLKDMNKPREPYRIAWDKIIEKDALHPAVLLFLTMLPYTCISSYIAIYGGLLGVDRIGLYFTVYAVFLLLTRPLGGALIDKYGYKRVLVPSMLCFAASFLIIGSSKNLTGFLIAAAVNAFGYGVIYPSMQSLAMSCTAKNRRGAAGSTSFLGADLSMLVGPALAGLLVDSVNKNTGTSVKGYSVMYFVMIIPIIIGIFYFLIFNKKIVANIKCNSDDNQ
jgi:MFS family permease